ncbi:MAG: energy transducer TonB [Nitrospirae bacterium]|nr:energy transducer TonB [Nitrospirota bacterium]
MHEAVHWLRRRAWNIPARDESRSFGIRAALAIALALHALALLAVSRLPDTVHAPLEVELLNFRQAALAHVEAAPAKRPQAFVRPHEAPAPKAVTPHPEAPPTAVPAVRAVPPEAAPQEYTQLAPSQISGEQARAGLGAPVLPPQAADRADSGPARPVTSPAVPDARPARSTPAPAVPDNTDAVRAGYQEALRVSIDKRKEYPLFARKSRQEGRCLVVCEIARDGTVRDVRLAKSTGHSQLDRAAVRAVGDVGRFPPVPPELKGDTLSFEVPVSFRLSGD